MTTRRTILQGAASLIAPVPPRLRRALSELAADSPVGAVFEEWRRLEARLARAIDALAAAEEAAHARGASGGDDCPKVAAAFEEEGACFCAMDEAMRRAARTPSAGLDDVILKLVLWRLADPEASGFANPWDMLPFAAYRDLLALTGCEALAHPADAKALKTLWDDGPFFDED